MSAEYQDFDAGGDGGGLLTPRQYQVLAYLAKGFTNSEIGEILDCSEGTIKNHVAAILTRLDVSNRTEAATEWARRRGRFDAFGADATATPLVTVEVEDAQAAALGGPVRSALEGEGLRLAGRGIPAAPGARVRVSVRDGSLLARVTRDGTGLAATVETDPADPDAMRRAARAVVALIRSTDR